MDRRRFLKSSALTSAAAFLAKQATAKDDGSSSLATFEGKLVPADAVTLEGHTQICEFRLNGDKWNIYEDLRTREGVITFVSSAGARVLTKSAEASFSEEAT